MRVLITGLNGIIGWNLYEHAKRHFDAHGTFRKEHPGFFIPNLHKVDLTSQEAVQALLSSLQPDYIIHSWAMCDLDLCETFPEMAYAVNVTGTGHFIKAAKMLKNLKKFIFISTDHVFSGDKGDYAETEDPQPKHVYGRTKRAAEQTVACSGLPYLIVRPGLVIGSSVQGSKGPRDFLFHRIRAGKPTHYFVDEFRTPIRAEILCDKIFSAILKNYSGILHIAGPRTVSRFDLAQELAQAHGLPTHLIYPRFRKEDRWASIRPRDLSLRSEIL